VARQLKNIFPMLRAKMAEKNDNVMDLSAALMLSDDSVRRRLRGDKEFELAELKILSVRYEMGIDELFAEDPHKFS